MRRLFVVVIPLVFLATMLISLSWENSATTSLDSSFAPRKMIPRARGAGRNISADTPDGMVSSAPPIDLAMSRPEVEPKKRDNEFPEWYIPARRQSIQMMTPQSIKRFLKQFLRHSRPQAKETIAPDLHISDFYEKLVNEGDMRVSDGGHHLDFEGQRMEIHVSDGALHGTARFWDRSGQLVLVEDYVIGVLHGWREHFLEDSRESCIYRQEYSYGVLVDEATFYERDTSEVTER